MARGFLGAPGKTLLDPKCSAAPRPRELIRAEAADSSPAWQGGALSRRCLSKRAEVIANVL